MKRIICLTIVLCLVLGSFSFVFADFTSTDSTTLSNIYKYMPTASQVTTLNNTLSTISTRVLNIYNALFDSNHSVSYWVHAINTWMSPLYTAISSIPTNHEEIKRLLGYVSSQDGVEVIDPYLAYNSKGVAQWVSEIPDYFIIKSYPTYYQNNPNTAIRYYYYNGDTVQVDTFTPNNTPILGALWYHLWGINRTVANMAEVFLKGSTNSQSYTNWGVLQTNSFTPISAVDGIYKWLSNIQTPVARLAYVLASDERIEAQEKAAANEQVVVNNFIDSQGSAAASTDNFGEIASGSANVRQNFTTGYSVSNMWGAFGSEHYGWFSQECADALDNSVVSISGNRLLKNDEHNESDYDTPLLDEYYKQILSLGGGNDD